MPSHAALLYSFKPLRRTLLLSVLVAGLAACSGDNNQNAGEGSGRPAPEVIVETAETTDVTVRQDYAGRARGAREVEVRARIQGILEERLYREGQIVSEGDSLFRIDPKPSEAALQGAKAQRQVAEADLRQAEREWNRISSLYERNAVSERDRDSARSALELAQANLAVAEAGVTVAELNLGYTDVRAPVNGVTSLEDLPEGSLIDQGTLLTTIVQQNPVHVRFALPENDAAIQRAAREAMTDSASAKDIDATLIMTNGKAYDRTGKVDFTASTLDPRTGTVSARAVFPNPDNQIIPGQFVRVRVQLRSLEGVVTVPEKAVTEGADGAQVFVVDDDSIARARPVSLGPVVDGRQVILDSLKADEAFITSGLVNLRDGAEVNVRDESEEAE
ncbi:efflux RND transporter periplasmic adaptor subunit [Marinobacter sp. TBZ242]|uniref:Efflux RND transporter periplasmic adaptor subunit n=1 Tax=Marinobacter azerbaijanicus TaxID=3050455 RepID=A0ABT7IG90_9GAMM|nr:efflux RND transporter periplasmic adaptor subunit [Marinobacter sp. TBZ242]MDL0433175.1 efflux RND transporter periplasmic adaptor subunit [Marinobacter sp. TBZ242]